MDSWSRRQAVLGMTGALAAATVGGAAAAAIYESTGSAKRPFPGDGAEFNDLETQIRVFFGGTQGRYLTQHLINQDDPRMTTGLAPVYDQFAAIYAAGPAEHDSHLESGMRMVVRCLPHQSMYKAIAFIQPDGINIHSTALTFYYSPPSGAREMVAGVPTRFNVEQHLSLVLFHRSETPDPTVRSALRQFIRTYPMPREQSLLRILGQDRVRVTGYFRRIVCRQYQSGEDRLSACYPSL